MRLAERNGYDIAPVDVTSTEGQLTLLSYVWPDMTDRLDRLRMVQRQRGCFAG